MNKPIRLFLLTAGLLVAINALSAQDSQIYTWTDENGVVHYVDTPPDNPQAVSMKAPEAYLPGSADAYPQDDGAELTNEEAMQVEEDSAMDGQENEENSDTESADGEDASYADQLRAEMAQKRETRRKEQAEREQNCARARAQVAALEPSRRVYFTNAQGETERMDDVERVSKVEEAKAEIARYCE